MMSTPTRTRAGDRHIEDFRQWLEKNSITDMTHSGSGQEGSFMPFPKLNDYLVDSDYKELRKLLSASNRCWSDEECSSLAKEIIATGRLKIFCILLWLEKLDTLYLFTPHDDLKDERLPFKLSSPPDHFPNLNTPSFFRKFCAAQWRFCAADIVYNTDRVFEDSIILPIVSKEKLKSGVSADIYKITLHKSYNTLIENGPTHDQSLPLVLKTYKIPHAKTFYDTEVTALRKLHKTSRPHSCFIRFYGAFRHKNTYNLLLEYADQGSLENYWANVLPPTSGKNIIKLWSSMFAIIKAVSEMQNGPEVYWHQDVKPANILVLSSARPNAFPDFRLADFGNSHTRTSTVEGFLGTDQDSQGTRTYGAPECYRPDNFLGKGRIQVSPNIDIWSLGCILSEFSVWLYFGVDGLRKYSDSRKGELQSIPGFHGGNCFHDGKAILSCVGSWHDKVRHEIMESDTITKPILQMSEEMLQDVKARSQGIDFCRAAGKILETAVKAFLELFPKDTIEDDILSPYPPSTKSEGTRNIHFTPPRLPRPPSYTNTERPGPNPVLPEVQILAHSESLPGDLTQHSSMSYSTSPVRLRRNTSLPSHVCGRPVNVQEQTFIDSGPYSSAYSQQQPPTSNRDSHLLGLAISTATNRSDFTAVDGFSPTGVQTSAFDLQRRGPFSSFPNDPSTPTQLLTLVRPSTALPLATRQPIVPHITSKSRRPSIPHITIDEAEQWRNTCKDNKRKRKSYRPPLDPVLNYLDGRDSVFIIDDSVSMKEHHSYVTRLFSILAYMIKSRNKTRLRLVFTRPPLDIHYNKHTTSLTRRVINRNFEGMTDLSTVLETILDEYGRKLQARLQPPIPPLNVYIFTDGIWRSQCNVVPAIDNIVDTMVAEGEYEKKVGLQFIAFGKDPDGAARLELLDTGLKKKFDIIDTTPCNGDLYKMIVGAIDKDYDYEEEPNQLIQ